MNPQIEEEK